MRRRRINWSSFIFKATFDHLASFNLEAPQTRICDFLVFLGQKWNAKTVYTLTMDDFSNYDATRYTASSFTAQDLHICMFERIMRVSLGELANGFWLHCMQLSLNNCFSDSARRWNCLVVQICERYKVKWKMRTCGWVFNFTNIILIFCEIEAWEQWWWLIEGRFNLKW